MFELNYEHIGKYVQGCGNIWSEHLSPGKSKWKFYLSKKKSLAQTFLLNWYYALHICWFVNHLTYFQLNICSFAKANFIV